jgi:glycosyltransferase involved in cell wall biosynthesis
MYYYIDHTSRFHHNTGIQRCVRAIAKALIEIGIPLRPIVWDRLNNTFASASSSALHHLENWNGPLECEWEAAAPSAHWSDKWLLIVELISGPYCPLPQQLLLATEKAQLKVAWIFHDAIPWRLSTLYGDRAASASKNHSVYMNGLVLFERVFANSYTTAQHLYEFLAGSGHNTARISELVKPLPLATEFPGVLRQDALSNAQISEYITNMIKRPFRFLCVGSLEPRKNHKSLMKAIMYLNSTGNYYCELKLVGWANNKTIVDLVCRAIDISHDVQWEVEASDQRLAELYNWCDATVYPSIEEGFGLPVAESMWYRKPCICSGDGALGELASSGGCLTTNTSDWQQFARTIDKLVQNPTLYHSLISGLNKRLMRTWNTYALELARNLREIS